MQRIIIKAGSNPPTALIRLDGIFWKNLRAKASPLERQAPLITQPHTLSCLDKQTLVWGTIPNVLYVPHLESGVNSAGRSPRHSL